MAARKHRRTNLSDSPPLCTILQPAMTEIHTDPPPPIPDDLTIPQFFLDYQHPLRPVRKDLTPWLIEDATGRKIGYEEVCVQALLSSVPPAYADIA